MKTSAYCTVTALAGRIIIASGQHKDAVAASPPANHTTSAAGPVFLHGEASPNAAAIIDTIGPSAVTAGRSCR